MEIVSSITIHPPNFFLLGCLDGDFIQIEDTADHFRFRVHFTLSFVTFSSVDILHARSDSSLENYLFDRF